MNLLLFLIRLLLFFVCLPTSLWKYYGAIQANDQWNLPAEVAIENVNANRILVDFRGAKFEVPRVFTQKRKYENSVLCLYDPTEIRFKWYCEWKMVVTPYNAFHKIESITNLSSALQSLPSTETVDIIYHGHAGGRPHLKFWSYREFTKQLADLSSQVDNMNIDLNTCRSGGFWDTTYTTDLRKIRMVTANSNSPETNSYSELDKMRSINPPIFETKLVAETSTGWKWVLGDLQALILQDLEQLQVILPASDNNDTLRTTGVFVYWGHGLPLSKIPVVANVTQVFEDKYHKSVLQKRCFYHAIKSGTFRTNAGFDDCVAKINEFGDNVIQVLEEESEYMLEQMLRENPQEIIRTALQKKIGENEVIKIERMQKMEFHIDEANLGKSEEVCGENTLSVAECEELARREHKLFRTMSSYHFSNQFGPKGCNTWFGPKGCNTWPYKYKTFIDKLQMYVTYSSRSMHWFEVVDQPSIPACKK